MRHRPEGRTEEPTREQEIAEAVLNRFLASPWLFETFVRLVVPERGTFTVTLPSVPRVGEVVVHPLRRKGKPKRWVVERVEWSTGWDSKASGMAESHVEVFLAPEPEVAP